MSCENHNKAQKRNGASREGGNGEKRKTPPLGKAVRRKVIYAKITIGIISLLQNKVNIQKEKIIMAKSHKDWLTLKGGKFVEV